MWELLKGNRLIFSLTSLFAFDLDRNDFLLEDACLGCSLTTPVTVNGKLVLFLSGDGKFAGCDLCAGPLCEGVSYVSMN